MKTRTPDLNLYRCPGSKERTMRTSSFAFLFTNAAGEFVVQAMGDDAPFGSGVCGATFSTRDSAVRFLQEAGFSLNAAGSWQRHEGK